MSRLKHAGRFGQPLFTHGQQQSTQKYWRLHLFSCTKSFETVSLTYNQIIISVITSISFLTEVKPNSTANTKSLCDVPRNCCTQASLNLLLVFQHLSFHVMYIIIFGTSNLEAEEIQWNSVITQVLGDRMKTRVISNLRYFGQFREKYYLLGESFCL
jgi:hypothetical protein